MSKSLFFVAMERQYALALGQYETAEQAIETIVGLKALEAADAKITAKKRALREKMDRISLQIRLQCDPEWDPGTVRPIVQRSKHDARGDISKAAYKVLKQAKEPMKARELARAAMPLLGITNPDEKETARVSTAIHLSMQRRLKEGLVTCEGRPARWAAKRWRTGAAASYANIPSTTPRAGAGDRPGSGPNGTAGRC